MNKLFIMAAIAAFSAACGGSDNKPATDPTTGAPAAASAAPAASGTPAAAATDAAKPADPAKK